MHSIRSGGVLVALALSSTTMLGTAPAQADETSTLPPVDSSVTETPSPETPVEESSVAPTAEVPSTSSSEPDTTQAPSQDAPAPVDPTPKASARTTRVGGYATQILDPTSGANLPAGSIAYTVSLATAGDYWLDLYCGSSFVTDEWLTADYDGQQLSGSIGSPDEGESCSLELYPISSTATGEHTVSFTVAAPRPEVRDAVARPDTFYPTVRDGYRDRTNIVFGSRLDSDVTVKIVSRATGRTVRSFERNGRAWGDYYQRRDIAWNGKNESGRVVSTGRYTAVITSSLGGQSTTARVPVRVASGHRTARVTKRQDGWYDSRDRTRGNCYASEVPAGNDLDCWGGAYAQATYRFRLPANARKINWDVVGHRECCNFSGRITKTGKRTSATSFRITVRVTGWRSYVVRRTEVTYTYQRAI